HTRAASRVSRQKLVKTSGETPQIDARSQCLFPTKERLSLAGSAGLEFSLSRTLVRECAVIAKCSPHAWVEGVVPLIGAASQSPRVSVQDL
ncbi:MAG: hypothetical protein L0312_23055, partial [Acidobacteria bacterium]|nr:hypothetical protein [Acidobacteriota bacterium]